MTFDACFPDSVVGFRTKNSETVEFVRIWLSFLQKALEDSAPESAQKNINLEILAKLVCPIPPRLEQEQIVARVDELGMAAIEKQLAIAHALKQSTAQRQNILRAAFAGQLVPQDPKDEPASVLLARIRAERASAAGVITPRRRKPKEAA